jgi:hypothetical protein
VDRAYSDHHSYNHTLPECYEDDEFDAQEFPYRFVRCELILQCCVEGEQSCECECDGYIDDNCDVKPARMRAEGRFIV